MTFSKPITEIITARFSCRTYSRDAIPEKKRRILTRAAESIRKGPLGSTLRFRFIAAAEGDSSALKELGTYGFIRNPCGFLIGAVQRGEKDVEDFGWGMEGLVLLATDLGLGTCWLGGSFTRGSFSRRIDPGREERIPAVVSVGVIGDEEAARAGVVRRLAGGHRRLAWGSLFFDGSVDVPLTRESAGSAAVALEMVRIAPSASNRQPWRLIRDGRDWHFFLERTPRYPPGIGKTVLRLEDLQRTDIGIAMCHFELAMKEVGLHGRWTARPSAFHAFSVVSQDQPIEYAATWEG